MVIHDDNLFHLSGKMNSVHDLNADELQDTRLKQNGFRANIPTLDVLCKAVKGKTRLLVEMKSHGHEEVSIVEVVVNILAENDMEQSSIFHNSEYELVKEIKKKILGFKCGVCSDQQYRLGRARMSPVLCPFSVCTSMG